MKLFKPASLCLALLLAGCASAPDTKYFVLRAKPPPAEAAPRALALHLSQFRLPDQLNRPQMVIRTSPQTVDILDDQRWAEPLDRMAARIFLEDLALRGIEPGPDDPADRLKVTVEDFMADQDGSARLSGSFTLATLQGPITRRFSLTEPGVAGNRAGDAEALSVLLGRLADLL